MVIFCAIDRSPILRKKVRDFVADFEILERHPRISSAEIDMPLRFAFALEIVVIMLSSLF